MIHHCLNVCSMSHKFWSGSQCVWREAPPTAHGPSTGLIQRGINPIHYLAQLGAAQSMALSVAADELPSPTRCIIQACRRAGLCLAFQNTGDTRDPRFHSRPSPSWASSSENGGLSTSVIKRNIPSTHAKFLHNVVLFARLVNRGRYDGNREATLAN